MNACLYEVPLSQKLQFGSVLVHLLLSHLEVEAVQASASEQLVQRPESEQVPHL